MKEEAESRGSPTPTPPECTFGAYEMTLPKSFKISTFVKEAKSGRNGFWLIAFPEPEIVRFKGVLIPEYERVILDILPCDNIAYTPAAMGSALEVIKRLKATELYFNGNKLPIPNAK